MIIDHALFLTSFNAIAIQVIKLRGISVTRGVKNVLEVTLLRVLKILRAVY